MRRHTLTFLFLIVLLAMASGCGVTYPTGRLEPIHSAVLAEDARRMHELLESGTDVNRPDAYGRTPLYLASLIGSRALAEDLIAHGADLNRTADWKDAGLPLQIAAQKGHTAIVELLLDNGTAVDARRGCGPTALMYAAWAMQPTTVELLLRRGADAKARDCSGRTALHAELPLTKPTPAYQQVVQALLLHGADVSARDEHDETPLLGALWVGDEKTVEMLLAAGATLDRRRQDGSLIPLNELTGGNPRIEQMLRKADITR